ncbi:ABC transporter substrate-binding protein, partial [Rhodococcus globerulus]
MNLRIDKKKTVVALTGVLVLVLTACGGNSGGAEATGGPDDAPAKIIIAAGGTQAVAPWAQHLTARGQGLFDDVEKKFGIDIEFLDIDAGSSIASLTSGNIDLLISSAPSFAAARAEGVDLTAVAELGSGQNIALVGSARHEAEFGNDLSKYANSTWGYTAPGSSSEVVAIGAAKTVGLNWDNLDKVAFGKLSAALPGLESGRLDLVSVDVGTAGVAVSDGAGYVVYNSNTDAPKKVIGTMLITTPKFAENYPGLTQAIVDVYLEGMKRVQAHSDDPNTVLAQFPPEYQKLMANGFDHAWKLTEPGTKGDGIFTETAIDSTLQYLSSNGFFNEKDSATVKSGFDNSFVEAS